MKYGTKLLHGYTVVDNTTGAASVPKYQTSTFHQVNMDKGQDFTYSRFSNPTRAAVEEAICCLDESKYGFAFSSGMAAISTVLLLFSKEDHIVACKDVYGGAFQLFTEVLPRFGIKVTFVDETSIEAWQNAITDKTKAFYIETPSNPTLKITDVRKVTALAKSKNILTIIDNTFMSPMYQKPFKLGVDISINSATKFLNGHSDILAGLVSTNNDDIAAKLRCLQITIGGILGVEDSWLLLRGLKTMHLRMERSVENAMKIAEFLEKHDKVKKVFYPGLKSHEGYEIHKDQAENGGVIISFDLGTYENVVKFLDNVEIPIVAVSLGGVESILSYPAKMSHACVSREERLKQGISDGLLRLSVGIEDSEDLIKDINNSLNTL